jgi:hypothetical protein
MLILRAASPGGRPGQKLMLILRAASPGGTPLVNSKEDEEIIQPYGVEVGKERYTT